MVSNHAVPGADATEVLDQVKRDGATRKALEGADLVVLALSTDETQTTLEAILDELDTLRAGRPTALRLATPFKAQCRLVEHHGGVCIDVRHTHPGPKGHEVIAQLLLKAGAPKEER